MHLPAARRRLLHRLLVVAALLVFFALALDTAGQKAITTDEPLHLVHALTLAQTGTMQIPEMHTPLTYRLAGDLLRSEPALPLVTTTAAWPSLNPYDIGHEYVRRADVAIDRVMWLGRFVVVLMGIVLGALLLSWLRALVPGPAASVAVAGLYALSPNLLAAASLLTTDMAATVTWFAAVYTWWRYWQRPGWGRGLAAGVALGLALAAKLTGALLLPVTLLLAYASAPPATPRHRPLLAWLGLLPVAALVLWALYRFETRAALPLPAYWTAWDLLLHEAAVGHSNFFLGRITMVGSWFYFPVSLLLKTPPLELALLALIPVVLWRERARWRTWAFPVLAAAVLLVVAVASRLNFGYRHLLPAIPFLLLLGGAVVAWLWQLASPRARPVARLALSLAALGTLVAATRTHPHHLAYFNLLAGGRGERYLGDSNLDWGQDLRLLAEDARAHAVATGRPVRFSYTGIADRARAGLAGPSLVEAFNAGQPFPAANPEPGRYAINASDLQGTGLVLGTLREIDLFDWFRRHEPVARLGGSIFVYEVAAPAEGEWVAHCAAGGRLLDEATAEALLGRRGLRHVQFDCATSWPIPDGPGWYVLPPGEMWIDRWLGATGPREVYRHRANAYGPHYRIIHWPGGDVGGPPLQPHAGEAGGPAALRAYGAIDNEWATLWQVTEATTAPLSLQAHLLAAGGNAQVADGLGYTADQWRPGDFFLQRHAFAESGDTLATGLYNYVTLEPAGPQARLNRP